VISLSDYENFDAENGSSPISKVEKTQSNDVAISIENLSINYKTNFDKNRTARNMLLRSRSYSREKKVIRALENIDLKVNHGTVLGIVGHNGAGKSTLLRCMAGILRPTSGRVEIHGRISTMLALGLGFNAALSGRQNVMLGGLASGMTKKQISEKFEEIADFADLGDFIDMPIRTYSSGMGSRLAFSVAVHMDPDILLIDEALSAGDANFKVKASKKMHELMSSARTMVVVSHALGTIEEICNDAIWLDHGHLKARGEPKDVIRQYTEFLNVKETQAVVREDF
jgi:lipopolysaccharide transport system ATP-binding protein/teichoic acid transport system ATP-binding protein